VAVVVAAVLIVEIAVVEIGLLVFVLEFAGFVPAVDVVVVVVVVVGARDKTGTREYS